MIAKCYFWLHRMTNMKTTTHLETLPTAAMIIIGIADNDHV